MQQLSYENQIIFCQISRTVSLISVFIVWCMIILFDHRKDLYQELQKLFLILVIVCLILFIKASNDIIIIKEEINNIEK